MKKVTIGIIGCGRIANAAHIPSYLKCEDVEIKYFCDVIPEKADKAVRDYGCGIAVYDYHDVLNDPEVDAVSICAHTNMHYRVSIDAMRQGKDVLSEKPVGRTYDEALEMLKVQQETGRILVIGVVNRFNYYVNKVRDLVRAGELGEVYHTYASFRAHRSIPGLGGEFTTKAVSGGGALMDWGVHYIDLAMYVLGDPEIASVSGKTYSKMANPMTDYVCKDMWASDTSDIINGTNDVDDYATALIKTKNNTTISINGCWAENIDMPNTTFVEFMGTKGGIHLYYCGNYKFFTVRDGEFVTEEGEPNSDDMYLTEVNAFVNAVRSREKLQNDISYVVKTAQILQGIYDSSDSQKEIVF